MWSPIVSQSGQPHLFYAMPIVLGLIFQVIWKNVVALLALWRNMKAQLIMHSKMGSKKVILSLHCRLQCEKLRIVANLTSIKNLWKSVCHVLFLQAFALHKLYSGSTHLTFNYSKRKSVHFKRENTFHFGDLEGLQDYKDSHQNSLWIYMQITLIINQLKINQLCCWAASVVADGWLVTKAGTTYITCIHCS